MTQEGAGGKEEEAQEANEKNRCGCGCCDSPKGGKEEDEAKEPNVRTPNLHRNYTTSHLHTNVTQEGAGGKEEEV